MTLKVICFSFVFYFPIKNTNCFSVHLDLPYNKYEGRGPTFNASTYMRYGRVSATVKSASVGGAITAVILLADGGDEIDFELLGGKLAPNL